jgi:hypothetical protein
MIEIEDGFIDGYWEEQAERAYETNILGCHDESEDNEEEDREVYSEDNFKEEELYNNYE